MPSYCKYIYENGVRCGLRAVRGTVYCKLPGHWIKPKERNGAQGETQRTHFSKYAEAAGQVVALVEEKQKAYGDSFGKAGEVLRLLYPNGIEPEKYRDALAVVRVVDKLFRIATRKGAFGESPWRDVNGYSLLSIVKDEEENEDTASGVLAWDRNPASVSAKAAADDDLFGEE